MSVRLEPWGPGDLTLLRALVGDPAMMEHLGGPETDAQIAKRQRRYEADPGCLKIVADGEELGWVGYWEREWQGEQIYEVGWSVLPAAQGRGVATAATRLAVAGGERGRPLHGAARLPERRERASNAICAKLGFTLLDAHDFEYPPGQVMRCNDWRLDLADPGLSAS